MREADRTILERNDFRLHSRRECMQDVAVDCEADQRDGRLSQRGGNGKYTPRRVRQRLQAPLNQVLESRWQLVGAGRGALELDRKERVSSGELVNSSEQRPRERLAAAFLQQAMQRAEAERAERNAVDEAFVERGLDLGSRLPRLDAPRNDEHQRLVSEAASRVSEGRPRGRVEPLNVIDCDRDGPVARQDLERCEERRRNGPLVGWLPARILEEERDLECAPLRWGKLGERLLANACQKVADARQRQDGLGLCGACPEGAKPASFRGLRCGVPNRCLADTSLALEQQRPGQRPVEEGLDLLEFGVAADDRGGAPLHHPRMMLRRERAGYAAAWRTLIVGAPPEQGGIDTSRRRSSRVVDIVRAAPYVGEVVKLAVLALLVSLAVGAGIGQARPGAASPTASELATPCIATGASWRRGTSRGNKYVITRRNVTCAFA